MIRILAATFGLTLSFSAQAMDFATADTLFSARSEGLSKVMEARAAYGQLAAQSVGEDKLFAVGQMSRLDYVRGELLLEKSDTDARRAVFGQCLQNVESINEANFGSKTEAYYTWKILCLTFWAEASTPQQQGPQIPAFKKAIQEGLALTMNEAGAYVGTLEGGAIARYVAGIFGNKRAEAAGLYKPQMAAALIAGAMNSEAVADRAFPTPLSGADYFENIFIFATNLVTEGQVDDAVVELEDAIESIEDMIADGTLPAGREYETEFQLGRLQAKLAEIN